MLEKHQLFPQLLREFPQFQSFCDAHSKRSGLDAGPYLAMSLFVRFLTDELYEKGNYKQVHAAFEQMERFLRGGTPEVQELVARGFLENLRSVASWKPYGSDVFIQFLHGQSRQVWAKLDAAWDLNLDDCGVLEEEVVIWRVVRTSLNRILSLDKAS
jgi:hypothetical protein